MAETQTPNYKWTKPDIGGDSSIWGNVLDSTFDAIDSVVWNNQQGTVGIGHITMFAGVTPPKNWLWCNGAVYLDTDVPALVPIIQHATFGSDASHTAVPNANGKFAIGSDFAAWALFATGGEYNHQLTFSEMPLHNHPASQDAHNHAAWQDAHAHGAWQDAHAHGITQGTHSHNIVTGNHAHGIATGGHSHTFPGWQSPGAYPAYAQATYTHGPATLTTSAAGNLGGNTDTAGNLGGYTDAQWPNVGNTDTRQPGVYTDSRTPGTYTDQRQPNVYTSNSGGDAVHNNMPPYFCIGFIIRYQ